MKNRKNAKIQKTGKCFFCDPQKGKANYNSKTDAEAGAFMLCMNGKIDAKELKDIHAYPCPHNPNYFHVGHESYYLEFTTKSMSNLQGLDVPNRPVA